MGSLEYGRVREPSLFTSSNLETATESSDKGHSLGTEEPMQKRLKFEMDTDEPVDSELVQLCLPLLLPPPLESVLSESANKLKKSGRAPRKPKSKRRVEEVPVIKLSPDNDLPPCPQIVSILTLSDKPNALLCLKALMKKYHADFFLESLARYIAFVNKPDISEDELECSTWLTFPFEEIRYLLWNSFQLTVNKPNTAPGAEQQIVNNIFATPARQGKNGVPMSERFDAVLVRAGNWMEVVPGHDYYVGRVRVIFTIAKKAYRRLFREIPVKSEIPSHFACVEVYTPFQDTTEKQLVSPMVKFGRRVYSIVPVTAIQGTIQRFKGSRHFVDFPGSFSEWTRVLDEGAGFHIHFSPDCITCRKLLF